MRLFAAVLFIVLSAAALPVAAQEPACTADDYISLFNEAAIRVDDPAHEDPALLNAALAEISAMFQTRRAQCAGLAFEGSGNELVGPFTLAPGAWMADATYSDRGDITITPLTDGDCDNEAFLWAQGGKPDSELLQLGDECQFVAEVDARGDWTLTFTPVS